MPTRWCPIIPNRRDEVFAEIYDALCEEFIDWQAQHPEGGEAEFLDLHREHPMRYATRLAPDGTAYLIGPQFYYSFLSALKIGAVITSVFYLFIAVISSLASGAYAASFLRMLISIPVTLVWVSASILGVFIALEKSGARAVWLDNWKATDLRVHESHQQISKSETFFDLGVSTLALLWLLDLVKIPSVLRHDGQWITGWAVDLPEWFWVALGALLLFDIAYCVIRLLKQFWSSSLRMISILTNVLWIALLAFAMSKPQLLSLAEPSSARVMELLPLLNKVLLGGLWVISIILAVDTATHAWRIFRPGTARAGSS